MQLVGKSVLRSHVRVSPTDYFQRASRVGYWEAAAHPRDTGVIDSKGQVGAREDPGGDTRAVDRAINVREQYELSSQSRRHTVRNLLSKAESCYGNPSIKGNIF
jgi:hypothetical protein